MSDYNLGTARGTIEIEYKGSGPDKAAHDLDRVGNSAEESARKTKRSSARMAAAGAVIAAGFALAVKSATDMVKSASDAEQSLGATQQVFGKFADQVIDKSNAAAEAYGLSANQYRESANLIGSLLKNQGVAMEDLGAQTDDVVARASDLAAVFGGPTSSAVEALSAAFKGEFDSVEKYGISIKQSTVNTAAGALAQKKYHKALKDLSPAQQKAITQQATMDLVMKQSKDSAGQFAAQTDTTAERQQIMAAKVENLKASLGESLLPVVETVLGIFTDLTDVMQKHQTATKVVVGVVLGLAAAVAAVSAAMAVWEAATAAYTAVQWALNSALLANPLTWVVVGIVALVAALVVAWKKSETFRSIVLGVWSAIRSAVGAVLSFFTSSVPAAFQKVVGAAGRVLGWVKANWPKILAFLTGPIGIAVYQIAAHWDSIKSGVVGVYNSVKTWLGKALNYITGLPGKIGSAFSGLWSGIANGLKSAINSVLHLPLTIPTIDTHIPGVGKVGGQTLIPALANGGVVTSATLALIGEGRQSEAVLPLSYLEDMLTRVYKAGQVNTVQAVEAQGSSAAARSSGGPSASRIVSGTLSIDRSGRAFIRGVAADEVDGNERFEAAHGRMGRR